MALTGELNDLSLAELIEFFCNQRKTGRLKVIYPVGAGYFYLKSGAVIHARFGDLRGIDAVYYALTQPNASFTFSSAFEAPEHSINQPWTSVVLEGLRRLDEGVVPRKPSVNSTEEAHEGVPQPNTESASKTKPSVLPEKSSIASADSAEDVQAFGVLLSASESLSFARRRWNPAMVAVAVVVLIAVVGVPWGWYTHKKGARIASEASAATAPAPTTSNEVQSETPAPEAQPSANTDAAEIAKRQREARARERAKALEQGNPNVGNVDSPTKPVTPPTSSSAISNKRATVQVTYDENGRVTAASGGDATALRIARQKRFPPGKPGSATITIPIN
jgi:cell division protein FtsN